MTAMIPVPDIQSQAASMALAAHAYHLDRQASRVDTSRALSHAAARCGFARLDQRPTFLRVLRLYRERGFTVEQVARVLTVVLVTERLTGEPFGLFDPFWAIVAAVEAAEEEGGEPCA